ncbi:hypothetical protein scyTo_0003761, partial [Scyliorhinus torazame]|nr:hypothetical protein [Scyliorhinus torazame]
DDTEEARGLLGPVSPVCVAAKPRPEGGPVEGSSRGSRVGPNIVFPPSRGHRRWCENPENMAAARQPRKAENNSSSLWIMGTTASAAQQTVSLGQPSDNDQSNGTTDSRRSISVNSFQTLSIHNKAKSIITNKVAPVLITYNCKEEFQIHDDLLKANYTIGRISDNFPEHYLVQRKYFMVCDVHSKIDVLNTTGSHGAPNFRQAKGSFPVFGMGQPSLNGFKRLLQVLQQEGYEEILFYCVREEPVVFLRVDNDFIPYTPRSKDNLHENLHDLGKDVKVEILELTIRKELYNFAQLNENINHVYHDIEHFKGEPRTIYICSEEDIHVTEEVYRRPLFTKPSCRYHRLPLSVDGLPLQSQLDAFINSLRETPDLLLPQDPKRPPPALVFSCQVGVGRTSLAMILGTLLMCHRKGFPEKWGDDQKTSVKKRERLQIIRNFIQALSMGEQIVEEGNRTKEYYLQRILQSTECYFYLVAFNYYLHEQYPLAFSLNFSRWMCRHPWMYRLLAGMNVSELTAPCDLVTKGIRVLVAGGVTDVLSTLREMNVANFRWVPKMPIYGMAQPSSEACGSVLTYLTDEKRRYNAILWVTLREELVLDGNGQVFTPREPSCLDQPISVPTDSPEQLEDFDKLMEAMKTVLAEDARPAIVFNCHNGKGRTTTAMVISVLIFWHFKGIPETSEDELVSVPDAKYTKGEFEVVMQIVRLLPDGHRMKKEVDLALDTVSETMTPMHYHLREIIICTYRQIKTAKTEKKMHLLQLRSLQYLERYIYLILFNTYLHLEKEDSWRRPFSVWMYEVAAMAGIYEILNQLGFLEFENPEKTPLSRLCYRWLQQSTNTLPFRGEFV